MPCTLVKLLDWIFQLSSNENVSVAVMYSRDDIVSWLLARKSNANLAAGPMQQTCLHLASARHSGQSLQVDSGHLI